MTNPPQEEPKILKSDLGLVVTVVSRGTGALGFKPSSFQNVFLFGKYRDNREYDCIAFFSVNALT